MNRTCDNRVAQNLVSDDNGCVSYVNEIFTYEEFVGGASGKILKADVTPSGSEESTCTIEIQYSIEIR